MTTQMDDTEYDDVNDVTDTEDDSDEWAPPTREDYERLVAESRKASAEAANRKRLLRDLGYDKNGNKLTAETSSSDVTEKPKPVQVDATQVERAVAKKVSAIYSGLAGAGVPATSLDRVARFIDSSAIHVDEDGIEGLAEQIDALKADYPELFKKTRAKATDAAVVGGGNQSPTKASTSWEDDVRTRFKQGLI